MKNMQDHGSLDLTNRQKFILFLISCDPGIKGIYKIVSIFDNAGFPSNIMEDIEVLLNNGLAFVTNFFTNGTPSAYDITEKGKDYLKANLSSSEIIEHIKSMKNPYLLLDITVGYLNKNNELNKS